MLARLKDTPTKALGGQCSCGQHIVGWRWTDIGYPFHLEDELTDPRPIDYMNALCSDDQWVEVTQLRVR